MMTDPKKLNLNSFLTIAIGTIITSMIGFVWTNVVKTSESVIRLEANQVSMQKVIADVMPRAEIELRFRNIEGQILELKVRVQANDLELIKMRDSQRK